MVSALLAASGARGAVLAPALDATPGVELLDVGSALRRIPHLVTQLRPDIVVIDLAGREAEGLEATRQIMERSARPVVLVTGEDPTPGSRLAAAALEAGALALCPLTAEPGSSAWAVEAAHLVETTLAMADVLVVTRRHGPGEHRGPEPAGRPAAPVVAVAASTGGPQALAVLLGGLPPDLPAPLVVVQHIGAGFEGSLASWLDELSALRVRVARHDEPLVAGDVLIAPSLAHLVVAPGPRVWLADGEPVDVHCPSATRLFSSVARNAGGRAVGVVLTGMGADGVDGLVALRRAGGQVLAQSRESCAVWGMPAAAVAAGAVDRLVPIEAMADAVLRALGATTHPVTPADRRR